MNARVPQPPPNVAHLLQQLAERDQEIAALRRDLTEALEQQTATSEILRVISQSPTDLEQVLDAVVENAASLCGGSGAIIHRLRDRVARVAASCGFLRTFARGEER